MNSSCIQAKLRNYHNQQLRKQSAVLESLIRLTPYRAFWQRHGSQLTSSTMSWATRAVKAMNNTSFSVGVYKNGRVEVIANDRGNPQVLRIMCLMLND